MKALELISNGCLSVRLPVIDSFPDCIFVTDGRREQAHIKGLGVDMPVDSFGQIREMAEFGQNIKNNAKFKLYQHFTIRNMFFMFDEIYLIKLCIVLALDKRFYAILIFYRGKLF